MLMTEQTHYPDRAELAQDQAAEASGERSRSDRLVADPLASRATPGAHLLRICEALPEQDRYLRFGYQATDEQIDRYVESIDFERDEVFGVFNRRLELIATAHLAFDVRRRVTDGRSTAEFGVSVLPTARGRGFGARLFDHAMLRARNRGVDTLVIHALSENAAMLAIARKAGAKVERDGSEAQACLKLPPDTLALAPRRGGRTHRRRDRFPLEERRRACSTIGCQHLTKCPAHIKQSAGHFSATSRQEDGRDARPQVRGISRSETIGSIRYIRIPSVEQRRRPPKVPAWTCRHFPGSSR